MFAETGKLCEIKMFLFFLLKYLSRTHFSSPLSSLTLWLINHLLRLLHNSYIFLYLLYVFLKYHYTRLLRVFFYFISLPLPGSAFGSLFCRFSANCCLYSFRILSSCNISFNFLVIYEILNSLPSSAMRFFKNNFDLKYLLKNMY